MPRGPCFKFCILVNVFEIKRVRLSSAFWHSDSRELCTQRCLSRRLFGILSTTTYESSSKLVIVTELCHGGNLLEYLAEHPASLRPAVTSILSAVQHMAAHNKSTALFKIAKEDAGVVLPKFEARAGDLIYTEKVVKASIEVARMGISGIEEHLAKFGGREVIGDCDFRLKLLVDFASDGVPRPERKLPCEATKSAGKGIFFFLRGRNQDQDNVGLDTSDQKRTAWAPRATARGQTGGVDERGSWCYRSRRCRLQGLSHEQAPPAEQQKRGRPRKLFVDKN